MLAGLSEKMHGLLRKLAGKSKFTEENIAEAVSEVRMALLEADVNYGVVKNLLKRVKERSLGDAVMKSVTPGQQFIKIVHDELVQLMGGQEEGIKISPGRLSVVMLCGLQGSGKTTASVKLANYLKKKGLCKKPLIAACDLQRPAAIEQLKILAKQIEQPVFSIEGEKNPLEVAKKALAKASQENDLLIIDTAGRLHVDEELMAQLVEMKAYLKPDEVIFVANASLGQDAVSTASTFNEKVGITGSILTMLDGNARGGAAISIREVTGRPLKFEGVGEKIEDLQSFSPQSMADRILGMGDTINLVRKAQEHIDEEEAQKIEKKLKDASFSYEDYLKQIQMVKKMGSLKSLLGMLPGFSQLKELDINEKEFFKIEAMIHSMTVAERREECEIVHSRRVRIAKGSGVTIDAVNKLVKSFNQAKAFFKNMPKQMKQFQEMMGGKLR